MENLLNVLAVKWGGPVGAGLMSLGRMMDDFAKVRRLHLEAAWKSQLDFLGLTLSSVTENFKKVWNAYLLSANQHSTSKMSPMRMICHTECPSHLEMPLLFLCAGA